MTKPWVLENIVPLEGATISDVVALAASCANLVFFLPGNLLIYVVMQRAPDLAHFLEFSESSYFGIFSGIVSFLTWGAMLLLIVVIGELLEDFRKERERWEREAYRRKKRRLGYDE